MRSPTCAPRSSPTGCRASIPTSPIVAITDQTLSEYKTRLPIDRALLARLIEAIDAAGAKVIGIDILFFRTAPADNEELLIEAIKRAKAKVVLAAADERLGLEPAADRSAIALLRADRAPRRLRQPGDRARLGGALQGPAGPATAYPKSFAQLLAEAAGFPAGAPLRRIAWLREPRDGSDTFLTIPAEALLGPADAPLAKAARNGLEGKVVILGGLFPDMDQHVTPMTSRTHERMPGAVVHAHIVAETIDGRGIRQLEVNSLVLRLGLALLAGIGFLIGWRYRLKRQGILLGSLATIVILGLDTIVFSQFRIVLPIVLALLAWFMGEFAGHYARQVARPARAKPSDVVHQMTRRSSLLFPPRTCSRHSSWRRLPPARADLHVIESTVPAIAAGRQLSDHDTITVPAGTHIRVVLPSGKTQTVKGPFTGKVADLSKGQPRNEGVLAWLKGLLDTGGATETTAGATRSIGREMPRARVGFSWSAVPVTIDGSVCVAKGAALQLVRAASASPERVTVIDTASGQRGEAQWQAGSDAAAWPANLAPRLRRNLPPRRRRPPTAQGRPARPRNPAGRRGRPHRAAQARLQAAVRSLGARENREETVVIPACYFFAPSFALPAPCHTPCSFSALATSGGM